MGVRLVAASFAWADVTFNQQSDVTTINALGNAVEDMHGAWTDYSASFSIGSTGTAPTLGNSTWVAKYQQIGKTVFFQFDVTIGSTFSVGSGTYVFPVPVPASAFAKKAAVGSAWLLDSGAAYRLGLFNPVGGISQWYIQYITSAGYAEIGSAGPGSAWAAGDRITASLIYEAA